MPSRISDTVAAAVDAVVAEAVTVDGIMADVAVTAGAAVDPAMVDVAVTAGAAVDPAVVDVAAVIAFVAAFVVSISADVLSPVRSSSKEL